MTDSFLQGGGEMATRMRAKDWSKTPLGPVHAWAPALRTMTSILLANRFPMVLWWGPDSLSIYNDAYIPVLGSKHPDALGLPVRECWAEIYDVVRPLIDTPLTGGPATWSDDLELQIRRHGFLEETHWTVAYSPVPDDTAPNGIGGVLATVYEITAKVVAERRSSLLRELGARSSEAKSAQEGCAAAAEVFARHPKDVPFALVYVVDEDARSLRLVSSSGVVRGSAACPEHVDLQTNDGPWPFARALHADRAELVEQAHTRLPELTAVAPELPVKAFVIPIASDRPREPAGVLVLGVSPLGLGDAAHEAFAELAATQLSKTIVHARAYEAERERAEALAEIDRAKTIFFSNVSHELRTPLTLILGPLEELLQDARNPPSPEARELLETARKNAARLLRLVSSLLDFSRIEAGGVQISYAPADLGALTAEVASGFRSLVEGAGLTLSIDCPTCAEPAYVDRALWEKIVLNLVSNAFKFTLEGDISVKVEVDDEAFRLVVRDTGIGIHEQHVPRLFERFYRVEGAKGRSYEGTGIGLALVRELARLHGGHVTVESAPGKGSTFCVCIPKGSAHLPAEKIGAARADSALATPAFVDDVRDWLGIGRPIEEGDEPQPDPTFAPATDAPHILVVDDSADMRRYLERLLGPLGTVEAVVDGRAALETVQRRLPDLVITDAMMPRLDGVGLVRALRADERTRTVPVILVSARAGEDARVEGISTGVDDYIVKPFTARELVARVRAQLQLARVRRESEATLRESEASLRRANRELAEADRRKNEFLAMLSHELRNPLAPIRNGVYILERSAPGGEQSRRALGVIDRQVTHMARLIDDLLDVTRISRGKIRLQREPLLLNDVVRATGEDLRELFRRSGVALEVAITDQPLMVLGDRTRLVQVIGNLLQNAAKFTPSRGRTTLSLDTHGGEAIIEVKDDGAGIEPGLVERLFEPFMQADQTLDRSRGGLGLGLALVKGLAELHGGRVSVASDGPGFGATFTVRLPIAVDAKADREVAAPVAPHARGLRLLVVEDNPDVAESLREVLELEGHMVAVTFTGIDGVREATALRPDAVLCDIGLPGLDGYGVARRLRADPITRPVFLVAMSGYAGPEDLERSRDAGFDEHVPKPPSMDQLQALLERIRRRREQPSSAGERASAP